MTKREDIIRQFAELIGSYVGTQGNFEAYLAIDGDNVQMDVRKSGSFGEVDRSETFITCPLGVMYWAGILDEWFDGVEDITAEDNYEDFIEDVIVPMIENQLEGVRKKRYLIRDAETGNPLESFDTYEEAQEMIYEYEMEDMNNLNFTEGFYEIYDTEEFEILDSDGRTLDDYDSFMEEPEKVTYDKDNETVLERLEKYLISIDKRRNELTIKAREQALDIIEGIDNKGVVCNHKVGLLQSTRDELDMLQLNEQFASELLGLEDKNGKVYR